MSNTAHSDQSFPDRSTAHALTALCLSNTLEEEERIITDTLDEQHQQYIDTNKRARRLSKNLAVADAPTDYIFKPLGVDELLRNFAGQR